MGAGTGVGAYALTADGPGSATGPQTAATAESTTQVASTSLGVGEIYERSAAGVVDIAVTGGGGGFGQTAGEGSGFVLDKEGSIVTNAHVVEGAGTITVTFANGEEAPATLVGADESTDVAIIDVDLPSEELTPLGLGTSADVEIGDPVVAIGSPFGLAGTVTSGIVSALDRTVDSPNGYPIAGAIQTDAAINPGNSGGPLLDATGKVIGVNAQIASNSGGNDGVGFAIPIDTVRQVAEKLVAGEDVEHAYLGVSLATVGPNAAEALGCPRASRSCRCSPAVRRPRQASGQARPRRMWRARRLQATATSSPPWTACRSGRPTTSAPRSRSASPASA